MQLQYVDDKRERERSSIFPQFICLCYCCKFILEDCNTYDENSPENVLWFDNFLNQFYELSRLVTQGCVLVDGILD